MKIFLLLVLASLISLPAQADWKNQSSAGVVVNHGNSRSQSVNAAQDSAYGWDKNTVSGKANYLRSSSKGVLSAKRWDATLKYERTISERFSLFLSQGVESDRFAGYQQRFNTDIGPKYVIYKDEPSWLWFAEAGYRYTRERSTSGARQSSQKGRVYTEVKKAWSESASSKLWIEYIPNFSRSKDWLLNTEFSTSAALNKVLALQLAYQLKYDNQPNAGATKKRDGVFTTSLVANY